MKKPTDNEKLLRWIHAMEQAADHLQGATCFRKGTEIYIRLGIPGLVVAFERPSRMGLGRMILKANGRDLAWRFTPEFTQADRGAKRVAAFIRDLICEAFVKAPHLRETEEDRRLSKRVICGLTADEGKAAEHWAERRGMTVPSLLRRGLKLALLEEAAEHEKHARRALRLVLTARRGPSPALVTIAEVGAHNEVVAALRQVLAESEGSHVQNVAERATLLGVEHMIRMTE